MSPTRPELPPRHSLEMIPIRQRIRLVREAALFEPEEMDRALRKPEGTVQAWERGDLWPTLDDVVDLSDVAGISTDIFLKGDKDELRTLGDAASLLRGREDVRRALWRLEAFSNEEDGASPGSAAGRTADLLACLLEADEPVTETERIGGVSRQVAWAKAELDHVERASAPSAAQTMMPLAEEDLHRARTRLELLLLERTRLIDELNEG